MEGVKAARGQALGQADEAGLCGGPSAVQTTLARGIGRDGQNQEGHCGAGLAGGRRVEGTQLGPGWSPGGPRGAQHLTAAGEPGQRPAGLAQVSQAPGWTGPWAMGTAYVSSRKGPWVAVLLKLGLASLRTSLHKRGC